MSSNLDTATASANYTNINGLDVETVATTSGGAFSTVGDTVLNFFKGSYNQSSQPAHAILGMPPVFNDDADPNQRSYMKHILADTKLVTITPGKPLFFKAKTADGEYVKSSDAADALGYFGSDAAIYNWLQQRVLNSPDYRYYGFQPDMADYLKYVNMTLSQLYARMSTQVGKNTGTLVGTFETEYEGDIFETGMSLVLQKGTNINEVLSNDFGQSKLDSVAKSASGIFKEIRYLLGNQKSTQTVEELEATNDAVKGQMSDLMSSGGVLDSILGMGNIGGVDKVQTVVNGSHLLFPHVWNDSQFDRTYNLTFRFVSPYGDANSIWRSIYVPFVALMSLAMPRQDTYMGYFSPFIFRIDSPGLFVSDMAVVTSFSWRKGGSDDLFTKDGLPLEMEVTLSVKDLYPVLMMSKDYQTMKASNIGFSYFIDNLAGVGIEDFKLFDNIEAFFSRKVAWVTTIDEGIKAWFQDQGLYKVIGLFK